MADRNAMTDALNSALVGEAALAREANIAREEEGFEALVRKHSRFVFRVAFAALGNVQDAEDAAQEVFFKIYRTRAWDGILDARAFLARAAWRVAASRRPRRKSETLAQDVPDGAISPERAAIEAHSEALVHRLYMPCRKNSASRWRCPQSKNWTQPPLQRYSRSRIARCADASRSAANF